jgi:two-component system NtrC family sensor kinase
VKKKKMMNIAVIGGGNRCAAFLKMLDAMRFPNLEAQIVAVADLMEDATGMRIAREKGIFTTRDYNDFFKIEDIDLVIELTGDESLLLDFLKHKPKDMRVLEAAISRLFSDMIRFQEEYHLGQRRLEMIQGIVDSVFSSIQDRVMVLRPDFRVTDANDAMLQAIGKTKSEVTSRFCHEVSHWSVRPCYEKGDSCPLQESIKTGRTAHAIHEHFDRNNEARVCEITVVPLKNKEGQVELFLEIMRDMTDELEKRVERRTRRLAMNLARLIHEDKMIALGKLVASSVHEINNPLTGIHALARLVAQGLRAGPLSEQDRNQFVYYLDLIDTESARCSGIVSNLLSFARQQKIEQRLFSLNDLIRKVSTLFSHKMQLQEVRFELDLARDLPEIQGDSDQIQQCLINLLFNAMEAMPNGGRTTVRTVWEASRNSVRLEVEDTGIGIPEDTIPFIFEPFYSTKSQDKGVGLGLSVVYGIIKEHQGSIYVKSREGKGSNFIIRFPAAGGGSQ